MQNEKTRKLPRKIIRGKLEQLEDLGLVGAIEESKITTTNYKEFIKNSLKAKHAREA